MNKNYKEIYDIWRKPSISILLGVYILFFKEVKSYHIYILIKTVYIYTSVTGIFPVSNPVYRNMSMEEIEIKKGSPKLLNK